MNGARIKPGENRFPVIEIDQRGKPKRQIRSWKLRPICFEQLRMYADCIVVEWPHTADVYVRINQTRNQEAAASIDPLRMCPGSQANPKLRDSPVANDDCRVRQRNWALGRNKGSYPRSQFRRPQPWRRRAFAASALPAGL
jgi:hypothetical protein